MTAIRAFVKKARILGIDPGTKRIGFALSDELGWTAQPLETYERRTLPQDLAHINTLVCEYGVGQVVLGCPYLDDGSVGPAAKVVLEFKAKLEEWVSIPVITWDETMTTSQAQDLLIEANMSRKRRKGTIDRVAAALILRSYLDHCANEISAAQALSSLGEDSDRDL